MATPTKIAAKTAKDLVAGLTEAERKALLAELAQETDNLGDVTTRELSPRERVVGTFLRERDHLDGCPVFGAKVAAYKVEAYDERAIAPGPEVRAAGVTAGGAVTVARCHGCGGIRYLAGTVRENIALALAAGEVEGELDVTL